MSKCIYLIRGLLHFATTSMSVLNDSLAGESSNELAFHLAKCLEFGGFEAILHYQAPDELHPLTKSNENGFTMQCPSLYRKARKAGAL